VPEASRLGDKAKNQLDAHGCPACPHPTIGPAIAGSPNVLTNGRPAIRLQDPRIHAACCDRHISLPSIGESQGGSVCNVEILGASSAYNAKH
jgi:uncharacterized Zn-binding protein involved in type VI secretion